MSKSYAGKRVNNKSVKSTLLVGLVRWNFYQTFITLGGLEVHLS